MKLCFLILVFCLVPAKSYENSIKISTTTANITCDQNSFFFTNHSSYQRCNEKKSCSLYKPGEKVFYFCLKKNFSHEYCQDLSQDNSMVKNGCFYTKTDFNKFNFHSYTYCHIFLLSNDMTCSSNKTNLKHCSPFCYCIVDSSKEITIWSKTRVLIKFSNKSEEDFGEFFGKVNLDTSPERKDEVVGSNPGVDSSTDEMAPNNKTYILSDKAESFIKTINGPTRIRCEQNSFIHSNHSTYFDCNGKNSCYLEKTEKNNFFYVCLKEQFQESKCDLLNNNLKVPEKNGCFRTQNHFENIVWDSKKYIHIFLLKTRFTDKNDVVRYAAFSSFSCLQCHLYFWSYTWILLKVSDESEEDFREFFMEDNPKRTLERKDEDVTQTMTFAPTKSTLPINKTFTVSSLDHGSNSSTKETPTNSLHVKTVIIIVLAVVIVLLIIIALVAFICYRIKLQKEKWVPNIETNEYMNEFPFIGNEANYVNTYDSIVPDAEQDFDNGQYSSVENVLYVTSNSVDLAQLKAQNQPGNKESAPGPDAVYAVVNKQNAIKDDCSTTTGDSQHVVVNGDVYAVVNTENKM